MSAMARYFNALGKSTAGYDLTRTSLTDKLIAEGIDISFNDDEKVIPPPFLDENSRESVLVVYTPAIPSKNKIFRFFRNNGYKVIKRSELLGILVNEGKGIAVAGTHGKTSVSTLIAHMLSQSGFKCNAFLGGVSKNHNSNLILSDDAELIVVEADEYDRSFLQLFPSTAVITSMDPDHLDIYGSYDFMKVAFMEFLQQVKPGGTVIYRYGLGVDRGLKRDVASFSYGLDNRADFFAGNIRIPCDGLPVFDLFAPDLEYENLKLGVPGRFNVENAVAAVAVALFSGMKEKGIREGLENFSGIYRRFEIKINTPECVFIDDYAHHPAELRASIAAVRETFPGRRITGIFQPHLYTRTRDFAGEFADSLEELDDLILLEIYPAREEPLPGVSSELIYSKMNMKNKILCTREGLLSIIAGKKNTDVLITLGAGNIDVMVEPIRQLLLTKIKQGL